MIEINDGLSPQQRAKLNQPYAHNSLAEPFSFQRAGAGIDLLLAEQPDLLQAVAAELDRPYDDESPAKSA